jgi:hypothetical protein
VYLILVHWFTSVIPATKKAEIRCRIIHSSLDKKLERPHFKQQARHADSYCDPRYMGDYT